MCPVCLATAAIIAGSATGTGGVTALIARKFRRKRSTQEIPAIPIKEEHDGREPDRSSSPHDGFSR